MLPEARKGAWEVRSAEGGKLRQTSRAGGTGKVGGTGGWVGQAGHSVQEEQKGRQRSRPVRQTGYRGDKQEDKPGRIGRAGFLPST